MNTNSNITTFISSIYANDQRVRMCRTLVNRKFIFILLLTTIGWTMEAFSQTCGQGDTHIAVGGTALTPTQEVCPNEVITYGYVGGAPLSSPSWSIIPTSAGTFANGITSGSSVTVTWLSDGKLRLDYPDMSGNQCDEIDYTVIHFDAGTIDGPIIVCYDASFSLTVSGTQNAGGAIWQKCTSGCSNESNWVTLGALTGSPLQVTNFTATTRFRTKLVYTTCGGGTDYSIEKEVTINSVAPLNVVINDPGPICADQANGLVFELIAGQSTVGTNPEYTWLRNGQPAPDASNTITYDPVEPNYSLQNNETIQLKVTSGNYCEVLSNLVTINFNTEQFPPLGNITSNAICSGKQVTFNCGNRSGSWHVGGGGLPFSGVDYTVSADDIHDEIVYFSAYLTGTCGTSQEFFTNTSTLTALPLPVASPTTDEICSGETGTVTLSSDIQGTTYFWSVAYENATGSLTTGTTSTIAQALMITSGASLGKAIYTITATSPAGCAGNPFSAEVKAYPLPANPSIPPLQYCDFQVLTLKAEPANSIVDFKWYGPDDQYLGQGTAYELTVFREGTYNYKYEAIDAHGCASGTKSSLTVSVSSSCDEQMNSIETIQYRLDKDNNEIETAHSKAYFDLTGKPVQTQVKNFTENQIFSAASVEDKFGRIALSTLSAPTGNTGFLYKHWFLTDGDQKLYDHSSIGNPLSVESGTVGWYYSESNSNQENVPRSSFPYSRVEYYEDGSGEVKKSAGVGEALKMGLGREVLTGTFPVYNELNNYLSLRLEAIQNITQDGSLLNEGVQSVVRDQHGNYSISISDKSGKGVMSARKGSAEDHVLQVVNAVESSSEATSVDYRPLTYFYILEDQPVVITSITEGTTYVVQDLIAGTEYTPTGANWNAGFYRIVLSNGSIELNYSNYFLDVSYQFYDDAGRLRSSLSPNGFKQLIDPSDPDYNDVDQTSYEYNHQGWLLSMNEPDAGETKYVYRKDGKIRFSQNAEQRVTGHFSYTHYDRIGRPVESGEYTGPMAFTAMSDPSFSGSDMKTELEKSFEEIEAEDETVTKWEDDVKKDWVRTYYDLADESIPNLAAGFNQEFVRGVVSFTENRNNKTWYSYDEFGRVTWMAQKPSALPVTFVTTYDYDFSGNVKTVKNSAYREGGEFNAFYHHYEYDADLRLSTASTSTDGANKKLRATYVYYLHGPLKRIELGEKLQGIDFVYNIQGWLTQINHPENANDPGNDGGSGSDVRPDVFGMVLDYYESAVSGLYSASTLNPSHNPNLFHGLPSIQSGELYAIHQGMMKPIMPGDLSPESIVENPFRSYSAENAKNIETISRDQSSQE